LGRDVFPARAARCSRKWNIPIRSSLSLSAAVIGLHFYRMA
jgi:hypothetical protein